MSQNVREFAEWSYRSVVMLFISMGAWFGNQVWEGQQELAAAIQNIRINEATMTSSRFTAGDWTKASETISQRFIEHDKRITKLEDRYDSIKAGIEEINHKLASKL